MFNKPARLPETIYDNNYVTRGHYKRDHGHTSFHFPVIAKLIQCGLHFKFFRLLENVDFCLHNNMFINMQTIIIIMGEVLLGQEQLKIPFSKNECIYPECIKMITTSLAISH